MKTSPTSDFIYAVDGSNAKLNVFSIASNGSLSAITGSPFTITTGTGGSPGALRIDPTGTYLYVSVYSGNSSTSNADSLIHVYSLNKTTGAPTDISGSPFTVCLSIIGIDIARIATN